MLDWLAVLLQTLWEHYLYSALLASLLVLYGIYYSVFSFFRITETPPTGVRTKIRRGRCPPSYPNGWYRLGRSEELKPGEVHEAKFAGRHIAYYRGYDNVVYALHAYCPHMGANLGKGGKVKNTRCIECPFHGWRFDGRDGKHVQGNTFEGQKVTACEYHDIDTMKLEEKYIKCGKEGEINLKKYITREMNHIVYIWLHAREVEPQYEPPQDMLRDYVPRGETINYVNCHIQEIPENGADIRHFEFLHYSVVGLLDNILKFRWNMKTRNASAPDFYKHMEHEDPKIREYQMQLYNRYLESAPKRKQYYNVLSLDAEFILFNRWKFYFMTTTGFQTGPATVTLYVRTVLFESIFQQAIQPVEKFTLKVYHTMWMNRWVPYWLSAYVLHGELRQVLFDTLVWNSKIFSDKLCYNLKSPADQALLNWRNWYSQFYDGAHEFEQKLDSLEW